MQNQLRIKNYELRFVILAHAGIQIKEVKSYE